MYPADNPSSTPVLQMKAMLSSQPAQPHGCFSESPIVGRGRWMFDGNSPHVKTCPVWCRPFHPRTWRQLDVYELDRGQPAYTGKCIGSCSQASWNYIVGPFHKQVLSNLKKKQRLNNNKENLINIYIPIYESTLFLNNKMMCAQELKFSEEFLLYYQRLLKKLLLICVCICVCVHVHMCVKVPSEGSRTPEAGVTGICELPDKDAESRTL